jgi:cation transport ATPase
LKCFCFLYSGLFSFFPFASRLQGLQEIRQNDSQTEHTPTQSSEQPSRTRVILSGSLLLLSTGQHAAMALHSKLPAAVHEVLDSPALATFPMLASAGLVVVAWPDVFRPGLTALAHLQPNMQSLVTLGAAAVGLAGCPGEVRLCVCVCVCVCICLCVCVCVWETAHLRTFRFNTTALVATPADTRG